MKWVLSLFLVTFAGPVLAQDDDPMALQRCVWSCLSNSQGAEDPAYEMCVQQRCLDEAPVAADPATLPGWTLFAMDPASPPYLDGRAAAVSSADGAVRLFYACGRGGDSYITLQGADGLTEFIGFSVNGVGLVGMPAEYFEGDLTFATAPRGAVLQRLAAGDWVDIKTSDLRTIVRLGLSGAEVALDQAQRYCFGN